MNFNGYVLKESIIHRMNPSLKFLMVVFVIIMIFIPFGFISQLILLIFTLSLYFLAKLPLKKLWNIIQSIIIMAILLLCINWFTYKGPGVVFDFNNKASFLYMPSFLNINDYHTVKIGDNWFLQGDMYGGKWLGSFNFVLPNNSIHLFESNNGFFELWEVKDGNVFINGTQIVSDTNNPISSDALFSDLIKSISSDPNHKLFGKLKYYTEFVNVNGTTKLFAYFYSTPWYGFSSDAITLMVFVSVKIFLMILIVTILTSTTSSIQLTCALEDLLNPLRIFRLPITEWSTTIALGLRFIPSLLDESNRIMKAQASRGLDFKNGNLKDKFYSLTSLVVPLFSIAFKKAAELANAMEARGYNPRSARTRYRQYSIVWTDWILLALTTFLLGVILILLTIAGKPIFIDTFGLYEALIMF